MTAAPSSGARMRWFKLSLQVVGFAAGVAMLWWVVAGVFKPQNREQIERLGDAPAWHVVGLIALAFGTLIVNGAIFQAALWPVKRLGTADLHSVNAIASLLALLPFKLSVLFRVLVHNRRDRVPVLTIAAWFTAVGATMAVVVFPALAASLWRGTIDALWWILAVGGALVLTVTMILVARLLADGRAWVQMERMLVRCRLGKMAPRVHEGLRMLAHGRAVALCALLRIVDSAIHTARFALAASIIGVALPIDKAVIAGAAYFLIGAAAPTGQIGAREAGTAGLLGILLAGVDLAQFQLLLLLVSATEATTLLAGAALGAAWLRPWRVIGGWRGVPPATDQQSKRDA